MEGRTEAEQGGAGQGRTEKCHGNAQDNAGHSALQDKAKDIMKCGTWWRARQNGGQGNEEDRALLYLRHGVW